MSSNSFCKSIEGRATKGGTRGDQISILELRGDHCCLSAILTQEQTYIKEPLAN